MECSCKVVLKVVRGKVAKLNASSVQKLGVNPWDATAGVEDVAEGKTFYAGSSEKKVGTYDANVEQMKGVDLTEINYEGGYEFGSERDYVEAQPMFQYWANVILFGNEEPQPLPDLPTLQTKVVEPKTTEQEVKADTGYELEKVIVLGVTAKVDSNIKPENIRAGQSILDVAGSVDDENAMVIKTLYKLDTGMEGGVLLEDSVYLKAAVQFQIIASKQLGVKNG